jgi:hypothetical protein
MVTEAAAKAVMVVRSVMRPGWDWIGEGRRSSAGLRHDRQTPDLLQAWQTALVPEIPNSGGPNDNSPGDTDNPAPEQPGRTK